MDADGLPLVGPGINLAQVYIVSVDYCGTVYLQCLVPTTNSAVG
jgi:hypothetical protein